MLNAKDLPNNLWAEAISTTIYLLNIRPKRHLANKTPYEALIGAKPIVSHLRIFKSKAFCDIPKENRRKLDAKSIKCILIGFDHKADKMYYPSTHRVFSCRDVIFHEFANDVQEEEKENNTTSLKLLQDNEILDIADQHIHEQSGHEARQGEDTPISNEALRISTRQIKAPIMYNDYALIAQVMSVDEPQNFEEAKDHKEWMNAMEEEYDLIMDNDTWELIELPANKIHIGSKWLFKTKFKSDGTIDKFKARLVAKGYTQKEIIDYEDTFASVAKTDNIKLMIALATKFN